ncbi:MAG: GNAT family N-acetyltransferase [Clostridiaceae bacterium]
MENQIEIRQIQFGSDEYKKQLELRNKILKRTIGLNIFDEDLSSEKNCYHIGCFLYGELVGTIILTKIDQCTVRIRQVAVEENLRGNNIGRKLMDYGEGLAKELGFKKVLLIARETAVNFYEKHGYHNTNERHREHGICYYKMEKKLDHMFLGNERQAVFC